VQSWSRASRHRSGAASTCADAGYRSAEALRIIDSHGYIPPSSIADRKRLPTSALEAGTALGCRGCHSWFNRFRKLLVRYEKLERSFLARTTCGDHRVPKAPLVVNIIYG
jgi:hypothetical protein